MMEVDTITLVSYEGQQFQVSSIILNYSTVLSNFPEVNEKYYLATLEIDSETLSLILTYFAHYNFSPPTAILEFNRSLSLLKMVPSWDIEFISSIDDEVLIKLIHSCLKLDLTPLLQLSCLWVANRCRDLATTEEIHGLSLHEYLAKEVEIYLKQKYHWASIESSS